VTRGAGSKGCADLWAGRTGPWFDGFNWHGAGEKTVLRLVQVKSDRSGPYAHFGPRERRELASLAKQTGGTAELWHWPPHKPCRVYLESEWP